MKFFNKFLVIFICTFISFVFQVNSGICSDNMPASAQVSQSMPAPSTQGTNQTPNGAAPVQQTAPDQVQVPNKQVQNQIKPPADMQQQNDYANAGQGFIPTFMKMIKSLVNVIILIIAMAGIIILYRRIKSKTTADNGPSRQESAEQEIAEPANVSEAVSSFVRHKIKKSS